MKNEFKVILCLSGLLLLLEFGARQFETSLSKDVEHMRELPGQAELLKAASGDAFKVLVLGNSLARCGIDLEVLQKGLQAKYQKPIVIARMYPDGSRIEEWSYGYRRYFGETGSRPDAILVTTGLLHLTDRLQNINGMGAYFVSSKDCWEFCRNRLTGVEDISRFLGARYSALWAHRDRVEPLVFYRAVPGYTETAQVINSSVSIDRQSIKKQPQNVTSAVFQRFADELQAGGTSLIIATVPMPEAYQLPEKIHQAIQNNGAKLIDLGANLKMSPERFPDDYHLDAEGAAIFTQQIIAQWPVESSP